MTTPHPVNGGASLLQLSEHSIQQLHRWLLANGWAGYDPYDLLGLPRFIQPRSRGDRVRRTMGTQLDRCFPLAARRLFSVLPSVNPKAMALFAEAYRRLHQATGRPEFLARASAALAWLEQNTTPGYSGSCWGYPFDWQSRVLIPRGTPSSVVSATAGDAFWGFYEMTGDRRYLSVCDSICRFFLNDLHIAHEDQGICFSYTPLDHFQVHNANLMVAHLLARVGREKDDSRYIATALEAARYTLAQQNDDGSICYWGHERADRCHIDHFHTGFELRSLYGLGKVTGDASVQRSFAAYYGFYIRNLFTPAGVPKMTPYSTFPIDIHSCAEAILCHSMWAAEITHSWSLLQQVAPWTVRAMQQRDGSFRYMIKKKGPVRWRLNIPYLRWGQAWMLRALAELRLLLLRVRPEAGP